MSVAGAEVVVMDECWGLERLLACAGMTESMISKSANSGISRMGTSSRRLDNANHTVKEKERQWRMAEALRFT
jgi:hypothetical protein